jgi:hypothetical protein
MRNNYLMKKNLSYLLMLILVSGFFGFGIKVSATHVPGICIDPLTTTPQAPTEPDACAAAGFTWEGSKGELKEGSYILLEPIPCAKGTDGCVEENGKYVLKSFDPTTDTGNNKLGVYLNIVIRLFIGLCAVAAVVMIVVGGIEYSTSELVSAKSAATERIQGALLGLLLALGAYTLLFTINPDLLNTDVDIGGVSLVSEGEQGIAELEETVRDVGPGTTINGKNVVMQKGAAAPCSTKSLVTVGGKVPAANSQAPICPDLLVKLVELKKIFPDFKISSMIRNRGSISGCHYSGPKGGNCADIVVTNGNWAGLCNGIMAVGGLNFGNEATNKGDCQKLKTYELIYDKNGKLLTTGPHLHVNFIGR